MIASRQSKYVCNKCSIDDRDRHCKNKHLPSTETASEAKEKIDAGAHEGARPVLYKEFLRVPTKALARYCLLVSSVDMVDHPLVIEHISPCPIAAHSTSSKQANQTIW